MPPPDANLYPEATGLARKLVNEHSEPQPLKLYSGWFCPFGWIERFWNCFIITDDGVVQRVWAALEEKGIPYQYMNLLGAITLKTI